MDPAHCAELRARTIDVLRAHQLRALRSQRIGVRNPRWAWVAAAAVAVPMAVMAAVRVTRQSNTIRPTPTVVAEPGPDPARELGHPVAAPAPSVESAETEAVADGAAQGSQSTLGIENGLLEDAIRLRKTHRAEQAVERLDHLLQDYPASPLAETAYVERLRALRDVGWRRQAARDAQSYLDRYPNGYARQEALQVLSTSRTPYP